MLKVENVDVYGWEAAIRGMRNPMNSWDKSDSDWDWVEDPSPINPNDPGMTFVVGENDLGLMQRLYNGGTEHRKFMRMVAVTMDITAPLYWWKEFDTYKVGTVANSCSTMHKIHAKEFVLDDFSHEHLWKLHLRNLKNTITMLNDAREAYLANRDKDAWWQMIQLLPSSYNQKRTVMLNYEVAATIIRQRSGHKLDEWRTLVEVLESLPYMDAIRGIER